MNAETQTTTHRTSNNIEFVHNVTELNIANTLQNIYKDSAILQTMVDEEDVGLVGALYDVNTGEVDFKDFAPIIAQFKTKKAGNLSDKIRELIALAAR